MTQKAKLKVYQSGRLTVVGFAGEGVQDLDDINVVDFRDQIVELVADNGCKVFAFDLSGVRLIPSGLLGVLASLEGQGVEVHLYNPSSDVREVLAVTNLDKKFPIHEVEL